jgi:hypothetical protein
MADEWCHSASIEVHCAVQKAFDYLADGIRQGEWALGSIDRQHVEGNLFTGRSMFNGAAEFIRVEPDAIRGLIHFSVGPAPEAIKPLALIRVMSGDILGLPNTQCVVSLITWRPYGTPDAIWRRVESSHEAEMFIIKHQLEAAADF